MKKVNVGIIGCGNISDIYIKNCQSFEVLNVAACADLVHENAVAKAEQYGIPGAVPVDKLLADPSIEIVANLTNPTAHAGVALAALEAGKHVYGEKPLAVTRAEGASIIDLATKRKLLVGCAPETFLGGGLQTCRHLIDSGAIADPVAATAFMMCHGHETWHPNPDFYYQPGGGPMFDMGPYYLTALISLMGPVRRVTGSARITFPERMITSEPLNGTKINVRTATHVAGVMDFVSGAVATVVTSFDVWPGVLPPIEIYGVEGTLLAPDPNTFGGPVKIRRHGEEEWREVDLTHGYDQNSRGIGVADMAYAIRSGRAHRASGAMAMHVLDLMQSFQDASDRGCHIEPATTCERPAALPPHLAPWTLDD